MTVAGRWSAPSGVLGRRSLPRTPSMAEANAIGPRPAAAPREAAALLPAANPCWAARTFSSTIIRLSADGARRYPADRASPGIRNPMTVQA